MTPEEFARRLKEWKASTAVLASGMPQSTEHERRAMENTNREQQRILEQSNYYEDHDGRIRVQGFGAKLKFWVGSKLQRATRV